MRDEIVRKAIERGRRRGFVTFDQPSELLQAETIASETLKPSRER